MTARATVFALLDADPDTPTEVLALEADCKVGTAAGYRSDWRQGEPANRRPPKPKRATIAQWPVETTAGIWWREPIEPPKKWPAGLEPCDCCEARGACDIHDAEGDLMECEWAFQREVMRPTPPTSAS